MKKMNLVCAVLFALCAVFWSAQAVFDIVEIINHTSVHSNIWVAGDVLCAVLWITAFIVQFIKFRSNRDE